MIRPALDWFALAVSLAAACDPTPPAEPETPAPAIEQVSEEPPSSAPDVGASPRVAAPAATAPFPESSPLVEMTFGSLARGLIEGMAPTADPHAEGFAALRAGAFGPAQSYFALAAVREPAVWKHPFNLACAAARAGDTTHARVALIEAVHRGGDAVVKRARRDPDLASIRSEAWFEPALRAEPHASAAVVVPDTGVEAVKTDTPDVELPRGRSTPIPDAQLEAIFAALRSRRPELPVARASAVHGDASGWLLYEYPTGKRDRVGACTEVRLVHVAAFDPLTLDQGATLRLGCAMRKVRRFDVLDIDHDGEDEILVDVAGGRTKRGFIDETEEVRHHRVVRVLRRDGSTQLDFDVAIEILDIAPGDETARRFELRDENADGHPDLVVQTVSFVGFGELDDELWPEDDEGMGEISTEVRLYDVKKDRWRARSASR